MVKGVLILVGAAGRIGKELTVETAAIADVGTIEEGPATGWECDTESMAMVDKCGSVAR
jgi:hypothetical protein